MDEKEYNYSDSNESSSGESSSNESNSDESSSGSISLLPVCGKMIRQNPINGYVSINDITKGTGKYWSGYKNKKRTQQFIKELEIATKIPKTKLITGKSNQDRWIHPYLAIHFCQWICPKLSVEISRFVYNFISGSFTPSEFTQYIQTISDNKKLIKSTKYFEREHETLKKELRELKSDKSSLEREHETLKKELRELKSDKSSLERERETLIRKLKSFTPLQRFKNICIDENQIKIKHLKRYNLSITKDENTLILDPK